MPQRFSGSDRKDILSSVPSVDTQSSQSGNALQEGTPVDAVNHPPLSGSGAVFPMANSGTTQPVNRSAASAFDEQYVARTAQVRKQHAQQMSANQDYVDRAYGASPAKQISNRANGETGKARRSKCVSRHASGVEMPKRKGGIWNILFAVALVGFLGSVGYLGFLAFTYWQGQQTYAELEGIAQVDKFAPSQDLSSMTLDWDALRAINPDVVAWVYIPDTRINYPVVAGRDNEYYLTHDFRGNKTLGAQYGAVFMDKSNVGLSQDQNIVLYGHHMRDGSMFAGLSQYFNAQDFNAHQTIYVLTPECNFKAEAFSVYRCNANTPINQTIFASGPEFSTFVATQVGKSLVQPAHMPDYKSFSKIFTLVTCDYTINDGREALFAGVVEQATPNVGTATSLQGQAPLQRSKEYA